MHLASISTPKSGRSRDRCRRTAPVTLDQSIVREGFSPAREDVRLPAAIVFVDEDLPDEFGVGDEHERRADGELCPDVLRRSVTDLSRNLGGSRPN